MKTLKSKFFLSFIFIVIVFFTLVVYAFQNPSVGSNDFYLEYRIANSEKPFYEDRNMSIDKSFYTFNNAFYIDNVSYTKLTIHSLDFINGKERIIFVIENIKRDSIFKHAFIDYKNKNDEFLNFDIIYKKDSIFIFNKYNGAKDLYFKGEKQSE